MERAVLLACPEDAVEGETQLGQHMLKNRGDAICLTFKKRNMVKQEIFSYGNDKALDLETSPHAMPDLVDNLPRMTDYEYKFLVPFTSSLYRCGF